MFLARHLGGEQPEQREYGDVEKACAAVRRAESQERDGRRRLMASFPFPAPLDCSTLRRSYDGSH
jgi:hypothetical protein